MAEIHELYLHIEDIDKDREAFLAKVNESNINTRNGKDANKTLLHMALEKNDIKTALALIRKGAKCDLKDDNDLAASDIAAFFNHLEILLEFKKHERCGFDPNTPLYGSPPLYSIVKTNEINLIEFWLKIGANPHAIICDQIVTDTILKAAGRKIDSNHVTKMRLLLKWGIGIKNDFTGVGLFDEITNGCIILNSYKEDKPITRKTPGCQNAYTNLEELKEAMNTGKKINIICKTSVFEQHLSDPDVYNIYKLFTSPTNALKSKLLFFINDNPQKIKSLEFLPDDLKSEVATSITLSSGNNS